MIKVAKQPESEDFEARVRTPGRNFLVDNPAPTNKELRKRNYWNRSLPALHEAYSGICAYTSTYMITPESVDHYVPISVSAELAYEWDNFRLSFNRINNRKGANQDVLDPFEIENGWFILDFPSCLIKAESSLPRTIRVKVNHTINSLGLNEDEHYVQDRLNIVLMFAENYVDIAFLEQRYPFIAEELKRQKLVDSIATYFPKR